MHGPALSVHESRSALVNTQPEWVSQSPEHEQSIRPVNLASTFICSQNDCDCIASPIARCWPSTRRNSHEIRRDTTTAIMGAISNLIPLIILFVVVGAFASRRLHSAIRAGTLSCRSAVRRPRRFSPRFSAAPAQMGLVENRV